MVNTCYWLLPSYSRAGDALIVINISFGMERVPFLVSETHSQQGEVLHGRRFQQVECQVGKQERQGACGGRNPSGEAQHCCMNGNSSSHKTGML